MKYQLVVELYDGSKVDLGAHSAGMVHEALQGFLMALEHDTVTVTWNRREAVASDPVPVIQMVEVQQFLVVPVHEARSYASLEAQWAGSPSDDDRWEADR